MKTLIYIDAFNLYFGSLKGTPYRWLNLEKFCTLLLPNQEITKIKYFTALVKARLNDAQKPIHQQAYLRALKTLSKVEIILGHYLSHKTWMPLADSWGQKKLKYAQVIKTEEKGSDVNLATHLIHDAYQNKFETAVIISNDSDLLEPIKILRYELNKKVGVINPHKHPSRVLLKHATFLKQVRKGALASSQFPQELKDPRGSFFKPKNW